ncbi:hypothetical protein NEFER03_0443 [Nematocida sp. LUAm3]|nr:hypothetical protein NEFER03_0443 [Nematocida sp. LUAm3]KAI5175901.1 hypothetical protein NEFER02_1761 [Nematocida sp. LUAm2]KAI5178717.1 hypothetical protein NEFER01_1836 [Nematocida sp. LUAm1]
MQYNKNMMPNKTEIKLSEELKIALQIAMWEEVQEGARMKAFITKRATPELRDRVLVEYRKYEKIDWDKVVAKLEKEEKLKEAEEKQIEEEEKKKEIEEQVKMLYIIRNKYKKATKEINRLSRENEELQKKNEYYRKLVYSKIFDDKSSTSKTVKCLECGKMGHTALVCFAAKKNIKKKTCDGKDEQELALEMPSNVMYKAGKSAYDEIKTKHYLPDVKNDTKEELKECESCHINSRKYKEEPECVEIKKLQGRRAVSLIDLKEESRYIVVMMDYSTRAVEAVVTKAKEIDKIIGVIDSKIGLFKEKAIEELITDNRKEFTNKKFKDWCREQSIEHRIVNLESHKINRRLESVVEAIREGLAKEKKKELAVMINRIVYIYNITYHSVIGCTPMEAIARETEDLARKK